MWTIVPAGVGDRQRHAVGHAVRDADELDRERADGDRVARADGLQPIAGVDAVLFELRLDERQRHRRAVDRAVEQRHHVRHGADVILVAVGEDQRLDLLAPRLDEGQVGDDQVDAELVGVGEHDAGVDEDGRVLPRHGHHVHAELAEASEGDDLERRRRHVRYSGLIHSEPSESDLSIVRHATREPWQVLGHESGSWERLKTWQAQRLRAKIIAQLARAVRCRRGSALRAASWRQLLPAQSVPPPIGRASRRPA